MIAAAAGKLGDARVAEAAAAQCAASRPTSSSNVPGRLAVGADLPRPPARRRPQGRPRPELKNDSLIPMARYSDCCAAATGARPGIAETLQGRILAVDKSGRGRPRGGRTPSAGAAAPGWKRRFRLQPRLPSALTRSGQRPGRSRASACRAERAGEPASVGKGADHPSPRAVTRKGRWSWPIPGRAPVAASRRHASGVTGRRCGQRLAARASIEAGGAGRAAGRRRSGLFRKVPTMEVRMPPPATPPTSWAMTWPQSRLAAAAAASAAAFGSTAAAAEERAEDRAAGDAADRARDQLRQQRHARRLDDVAGDAATDRTRDRLDDDRNQSFHPLPSIGPACCRAGCPE